MFPVSPVWEATETVAMLSGTTRALLTPPWRILLLSDGSVTRHLQLLTDTRTRVDVLREQVVGRAAEAPGPDELRLFGEQELMQRQVYLRNGEAGTIYGYAASWWGVDTCVPAPARAPLMPPDADAAADVALAGPLDGTAPNRQDEGVHDGPGDAHLDEPRPRRT